MNLLFAAFLFAQLIYSSEIKDKQECQICKDDLEDKFSTYYTPCSHKYHNDCLYKWVKRSQTCPECRNDLSGRVTDIIQHHQQIKQERLKQLHKILIVTAKNGDDVRFNKYLNHPYYKTGGKLPLTPKGETLLHFAAFGGNRHIVKILLEQHLNKINVNAQTKDGLHTALIYAVQPGKGGDNSHDIVKMLLEAGADSKLKNCDGRTAFDFAAYNKLNTSEGLLSQTGLNTQFMNAVQTNDPEKVKKLIAAGADLNCKDGEGNTVLHFFVNPKCEFYSSMKSNMMQVILSLGADVDAVDNYGFTPLHHGVQNGLISKVVVLLKAGANANAQDFNRNTALMFTGLSGNIDILKILLHFGADKHMKNKFNNKALNLTSIEDCRALLQ